MPRMTDRLGLEDEDAEEIRLRLDPLIVDDEMPSALLLQPQQADETVEVESEFPR